MTHLYCTALPDWYNALFSALSSSVPGNFNQNCHPKQGECFLGKNYAVVVVEVQIKHMKYRWVFAVK